MEDHSGGSLETRNPTGGTGGRSRGDRIPISRKLRFKVLRRCGFRCRYCGCPSTEVPISRGGTNDESNLAAACADCNVGKGAGTAGIPPGVSFLSWLITQTERDDWVGDLAKDQIRSSMASDPHSFKDLVEQIRRACGGLVRDSVIGAAWHAWREYNRRGGRPTLLMRRMQAESAPVEIELVAAEVNTRVVRVADVQLREWALGKQSVWESLYSWLVSTGFPEEDLHNCVHVGDVLKERLLETEAARIRGKKTGGRRTLRGGRLNAAVAWGYIGSGPPCDWRSRTLVGDALFVLSDRDLEYPT